MNYFADFMKTVAELPDLVSLLVCPALLIVVGFLLAVFGARKAYLPAAVAFGGAGLFLICCEDASFALAYTGLYLVLAVIVSLLFLIPFRSSKEDKGAVDELYEKFHVSLDMSAEFEPAERDGETYDKEECGLRLAHANALIEKLQKSELSASDRLEVDAISHTLAGYGDRELTADELRALNDCLATVLKLTAKYKL